MALLLTNNYKNVRMWCLRPLVYWYFIPFDSSPVIHNLTG
jgi:hypothetical protein